MGVEKLFARGGLYARGTAVGQELPALFVVLEVRDHDLAENLLMHRGIENRAQNFDTPVQVARHHVGGGNINRRFRMWQRVTRAEAIYTPVLEDPANDGFYSDIFRQIRNPRPQATDPAHYEIDGNARGRSIVKRVDDAGIDQRVHFHPDRRWFSCLGVRNFLRNVVKDTLA